MNILFIAAPEKKRKLQEIIDLQEMEKEPFKLYDSSTKNDVTFYDLMIIDYDHMHKEELQSRYWIKNLPFLLLSPQNKGEVEYFENFLGYFDLEAHPLANLSFLHTTFTNIKLNNMKKRHSAVENKFTSFDLQFFKTLPTGIVFQDRYGNIIDINPAAEKILEATQDQLTGVTSLDPRWHTVNEEGSPLEGKDHPAMITLKTKKAVHNFVMGVYSPSKEKFKWISVTSIPIFDEFGDIDLVYAHFYDITEEKKNLDELHILASAVLYSPISILITDARGIIQSVNPMFERVSGYSAKELIGRNPNILRHDKSITNYEELWGTILDGRIWKGEFLNRRKDGVLYSEAAVIAPIKNEAGEIIHFISLKEDITDLKKTQRCLEERNQELHELAIKRKQLLHILTHDLMNPLSTISLATEVLQGEKLPIDMVRELLRDVHKGALKARELIDVNRKMLALEESKYPLTLSTIDLKKAITETLELLKNRFSQKNISVVTNIEPDLTVRGEESSFQNSVLNNILTNALKFSFEKGTVTIRANKANNITHITIADQGIGIPKDILQNLFNSGVKTHRKGTNMEDGTGFGMPIMKMFVESYGGSVEVESICQEENSLQHGTTFHLKIPTE